MDYKNLEQLARECGFLHTAPLDPATLVLLPEVREMCAANTCGMYGKNHACPPACGSLEECRQSLTPYHGGILVQTVGQIEDSLDFEGMQELEAKHRENFLRLTEKLRALVPSMLPLGAGCCPVCRTCAGPEEPCRFPERKISSLEAYGILVSDLCRKNGLDYYYGPGTIAYTSCCLLESLNPAPPSP